MVSSLHAESAQAKSEQEHAVIDYAQSLVRFRSVTPHSAGAIEWLIDALTDRGFHCHEFAVQGAFLTIDIILLKRHLTCFQELYSSV